MTWGLKQTCLPDIHDNTFEGPHWNLSPYGPNTANMGTAVDIYVLTVLSYLERIGVARTGRNLGPDGILDWTESRLCKIIMGLSTACQLCQPPAICTHSRYPQHVLYCNQHPKIVADQTIQYSFMCWFLRLAHHSHSFV